MPSRLPDQIVVSKLELRARIGVTETEQARRQRLTVSLTLTPAHGLAHVNDRLENTVNYSAVCKAVRAMAAQPPRRLIETFAEEIAAMVLERFACVAVEVELRKYILPDTEYVAVRLSRRHPTHAHEA